MNSSSDPSNEINTHIGDKRHDVNGILQSPKADQRGNSEPHVDLTIIDTCLSAIEISINKFNDAQVRFRYASRTMHLLKNSALDILQLVEPLIVARNSNKSKMPYRLISGLRTYQFLYQMRGIESKCVAILKEKPKSGLEQEFHIFDSYVRTIINLPGNSDAEYVGATLFSETVTRKNASEFLNVQTQEDVAMVFGVNRSTLREWKSKLVSEPNHESQLNG